MKDIRNPIGGSIVLGMLITVPYVLYESFADNDLSFILMSMSSLILIPAFCGIFTYTEFRHGPFKNKKMLPSITIFIITLPALAIFLHVFEKNAVTDIIFNFRYGFWLLILLLTLLIGALTPSKRHPAT